MNSMTGHVAWKGDVTLRVMQNVDHATRHLPLGQGRSRDLAGNRGRVGAGVELALQASRLNTAPVGRSLPAALSAIGGSDVDDVALNLSDHVQLFEFLRAVEAHKARANAIKERLRLLMSTGLKTVKETSKILEARLTFCVPGYERENRKHSSTKLRTRRSSITSSL